MGKVGRFVVDASEAGLIYFKLPEQKHAANGRKRCCRLGPSAFALECPRAVACCAFIEPRTKNVEDFDSATELASD
jgi:hypothetical protein